jgi:N-acyl homoserine lactone hydrolase
MRIVARCSGDVVAARHRTHTWADRLLVFDSDTTFFLAGNSSYTQGAMLRGLVDGVAPDERAASTTLARIRN